MNEQSMGASRRAQARAVVIAALAALAPAAPAAPAHERETLANHRLAALDGETTSLAAFRGEVVVVNFWASWCAPCRHELPIMDRWDAAWSGRGARVVAVSIDKDVKNARRFAREMKLKLTVLHDGPEGLARTLDIPSVPYTLLLDRDGNVVNVVQGSAAQGLATIERAVESMLAARRGTPAQQAGMAAPGGER